MSWVGAVTRGGITRIFVRRISQHESIGVHGIVMVSDFVTHAPKRLELLA